VKITVYCASSENLPLPYRTAARELGALIARRGHTLVYGGGRFGLMGELSRAALAEGGKVVGIILDRFLARGVAHEGAHEMHSVTDMRSRKRGLDEAGDAYVALPGGFGTLEEILEILSFKQLGLHARPVVLINIAGYFDPLLAQFDRGMKEGFIDPECRSLYEVAKDAASAMEMIENARTFAAKPKDG
jgi:uncharacterized protein (TIGR00730 family)